MKFKKKNQVISTKVLEPLDLDTNPFEKINQQVNYQNSNDPVETKQQEEQYFDQNDITNFNALNFGKQVFSQYQLKYNIDDDLIKEIDNFLPRLDHNITELINLQSKINFKKLNKVSLTLNQMNYFKNLFQCLHVLSTNKNLLQTQDIYHSLFFPIHFKGNFDIRNWEKKHLTLDINHEIESDIDKIINRLYFLSKVTIKNYKFVEDIIKTTNINHETRVNEANDIIKNLNLRVDMIRDIKKTLRFCLTNTNDSVEYLIRRAL